MTREGYCCYNIYATTSLLSNLLVHSRSKATITPQRFAPKHLQTDIGKVSDLSAASHIDIRVLKRINTKALERPVTGSGNACLDLEGLALEDLRLVPLN